MKHESKEEYLARAVKLKKIDGEWRIAAIADSVYGNVRGDITGDVLGDIGGEVWGDIGTEEENES